jgi:hypothetical protein
MEGAYIVVFIRNEAKLAQFFRQMPIRQKQRKNSKFLTVSIFIGPSFDSEFC